MAAQGSGPRWLALTIVCAAGLASTSTLGAEETFRLRLLGTDPAGGGDAAIAPDGKSFVTSSRRGGDWDLWMYDLETDEWTQLTDDPAEDFEAQWSPDGGRLVFTSTRAGQKDIWVLDRADGSLTRLTTSEYDDEYPQWSPDGKSVVYTGGPWGENDYFVVSASGGEPRKVSREPGTAGACAFAPDGDSLICHRYNLGLGDLLAIELADGRMREVTSGPAWDYKAVYSPDGEWIAFSRSVEGPSAIHVMPARGGAARPLVNSGHSDRWPSWSHSGEHLFFHRLVIRGTGVERFDRESGERQQLVEADEQPLQASLSPDGRQLAFCAQRVGRKTLRVRDLESGTTRDLRSGTESACFPRFSPDGRKIAFVLKQGDRWEIATIASDGSGEKVWTAGKPGLRGMDGPVDWSPDGRWLVFHGDTKAFESDLYVVDTESGGIRNLTRDAWFDEAPSFSLAGDEVHFMSTRGGGWTWGLYALSLNDGSVRRLAGPDYVEKNYLRVGPDGGLVWTFRDGEGVEHLAEKSPGAAAEVEVAGVANGARWPSYSANGRWLIYSVVEEYVEYWMAEHPFGAGTSLLDQKLADSEPEAPEEPPLPPAVASSARLWHSENPGLLDNPETPMALAQWKNPVNLFKR